MTIRPDSPSGRIVPSDSTEVATGSPTAAIVPAGAAESVSERALAAGRGDRADARRSGRDRIAVGPAARRARGLRGGGRVRAPRPAAAALALFAPVDLLVHRPPHDPARGDDGELQEQE